MKKTITVATAPAAKTDGYYVNVRSDADFCEGGSLVTQTIGPFSDNELDSLNELLNVLDGCLQCGGEEAEDAVPDFGKWLSPGARSHRLAVKLPRNYEAGGHADIMGYDVTYYRGGIPYKCSII